MSPGRHSRRRGVPVQVADRSGAARGNGLRFDRLPCDEYDGGKPGFLEGLDEREQPFVAEVPQRFRVLSKRPRGARPKKGWTGKRVDHLARFRANGPPQPWRKVPLARRTLDAQEWEVRAAQVHLLRNGERPQRTYWLIVAHNKQTGETTYVPLKRPRRHAAGTPAVNRVRPREHRTHLPRGQERAGPLPF